MKTAIDVLNWLDEEASKLWKAAASQPFVQPGGKLPPEYDRAQAVQNCINRLRAELPAPSGIWPASKLPTCPKCGWPPMVDEENADENGDAPIVCAC